MRATLAPFKPATPTWRRAVQGEDCYDILNLIQIHRVDTGACELVSGGGDLALDQ